MCIQLKRASLELEELARLSMEGNEPDSRDAFITKFEQLESAVVEYNEFCSSLDI